MPGRDEAPLGRVRRVAEEGTDAIATAPGDLPRQDIIARFEALAWEFRHDNTIVPLIPGPNEPVLILATAGVEIPLQWATVYYTTDGSLPDAGSASVSMQGVDVYWDPHAGLVTRWGAQLPGQPAGTVVRYRIGGRRTESETGGDAVPDVWAHDGQGFWFRYPGADGISTFAYLTQQKRPPFPAWMEDAVVYHIFLDRFHPGNETGSFGGARGPRQRHGGTFEGVRRALPYLIDLGVTCLWFSPLGPSETYHRYDTIDYLDVDPALGTIQDLQALVAEAHEHGIRTWLDFVPNHSSWHHPAFLDAQRDHNAPTYSWYTFDEWPHRYRSFMQTSPYLPSLNTDDAGARAHLIEAARFWLREVGVDGFRLDHAIGPGMDFWVALRVGIADVKEDAVLVGEATDTVDCLRRYGGKLHGILDFPLARALRSCFGTGAWTVDMLDSFLDAYDAYMAAGPGRVSFLDNHDMDRFLWLAHNDTRRLKMAAVCQFTLGPPPTVYYGTEIGMTQQMGTAEAGFGGDAEARRDMSWDDVSWDRDLLSFYRALIRLRRHEPAMRSVERERAHLDSSAGTYAYLKKGRSGLGTLLTVFNLGNEAAVIPPAADRSPALLLSTGPSPRIDARGAASQIVLAPMTAAILRV